MRYYAKVIQTARDCIGFTSLATTQDNKFNRWYYGGRVSNPSLHWCMVFAAWCYAENGYGWDRLTGGTKTASCAYAMHYAQQIGRLRTARQQFDRCLPGSLVFFSWKKNGRPNHVGLLVDYNPDAGTVTTIDGNTEISFTETGVAEKTRDASYVCGIYEPDGIDIMDHSKEPSEWARSAWDWATTHGITDGSKPHEPATREQVVAMLSRFWRFLQ